MNNIKGIIPPLVTPMLGERELDVEGLENLVEHVLAGGVHGLFILGTTGEGPSLTYEMRIELIKRVCDQVKGRVPVLVGIMDASFERALYIARNSHDAGAQAAVVAPPFFYKISQSELLGYVDKLIDEIKLPTVLYNNPALTKINFDLDTARKLAQKPQVVGFKDSSGDATYFQKLKATLSEEEVPLLMGPEELLAESLMMGGDGGVPGGANVFPELYVDLYDAVQNEEWRDARKLHSKILCLSSIVYEGSEYASSRIIGGIKVALAHMGICRRQVAPPFGQISPSRVERIADFVDGDVAHGVYGRNPV